MPSYDFFRCPTCSADLQLSDHDCNCSACGNTIEIEFDIPLLVRDVDKIRADIEEARKAGKQEWYDGKQDSYLTGPWRHHVKKRLDLLHKFMKNHFGEAQDEGRIALDLGCGDGFNGSWIREWFPDTLGSDYNISRVLRAKESGNYTKTFMADVTNYPIQDNTLDFVLFNHVLEHIPDDVSALREVRRILKPNGLLILGVPNEGAAFWQLAYRLQPDSKTYSDHVHFYTAKSLAPKCKEAGFHVNEVHHIGWGVPHWGLDSRVRGYKFIDDAFEAVGKRLCPSQATSLYLLLSK